MKIRQFLTIVMVILTLTIGLNSCNLLSSKKYKKAIEQADSFFNKKKYNDAKNYYAQAKELKPDDKYPVQRIKEIDKIIKLQKVNAQYKKEIQAADKLFGQESYNDAKNNYMKASELKPKEKYPKDQINKIDVVLAEIQAQQEFLNNPYHIVVGCFAVESNATKLHDKLMSEGYKSRIIPMYGGKYSAVTINSYNENRIAYNDLGEAKSKFVDGAWVYKK